jgi:hypothetical protein
MSSYLLQFSSAFFLIHPQSEVISQTDRPSFASIYNRLHILIRTPNIKFNANHFLADVSEHERSDGKTAKLTCANNFVTNHVLFLLVNVKLSITAIDSVRDCTDVSSFCSRPEVCDVLINGVIKELGTDFYQPHVKMSCPCFSPHPERFTYPKVQRC